MGDSFLRIENISKRYGTFRALRDVSFTVPKGSIYGLLGPNGAGKTTLIRIINQILYPDTGYVEFDGEPLRREHVWQMGYLPEERGLYRKMKVGDQALFLAQLKGIDKTTARRELQSWFEKFGIEDWWDKKVENLSKGMAQKVQFIITVLHRPKLLIFDEPFSGFDPINVQLLKKEILTLRKEGATVLFSTHNMESVEALCEHITLINRSRNILTGSVEQIRREYSEAEYIVGYEENEAVANHWASLPTGWRYRETQAPEGSDKALTYGVVSHDDTKVSVAPLLSHLGEQGVEVRYFTERKASMNNIFIKAVQESGEKGESVTDREEEAQ